MGLIAIFEAGRTIPDLSCSRGDFADWIAQGMGLSKQDILIVEAFNGAPLPAHQDVEAAIVTGSHAMVTDHAPWSEKLADWLRQAVQKQIPALGICYGHQLLAHALGGQVGYHPAGREIGTVTLHLHPEAAQDPLFCGLPLTFPAHVTHSQSVLTLPPGARLLASSKFEPHQAFTYGPNAWGIQFHPEFDAKITQEYIRYLRETLVKEGFKPDDLLHKVTETPQAASVLRRFYQWVKKNNPERQWDAGKAGNSKA